jgi:hypothetical protein
VAFAGQDISASKPIQRIGIRTRDVTTIAVGIAVILEIPHRAQQHCKLPLCRQRNRWTYAFNRVRADRLRSTIRREVGSSIAAAFSNCVRVRETVSMVSPR